MEKIDIKAYIDTLTNELNLVHTTLQLEETNIKYLGRNGILNTIAKDIVNSTNKVEFGKSINELKVKISEALQSKEEEIKNNTKQEQQSTLDLTIPVLPKKTGNLHPTTLVINELVEFFSYYGFSVLEGPEIEDDFHNFEMMGVPKNHPARELQDTLYIKEPDLLLRTQTSNEEARVLKREEIPIRVIIPGKVFRNETASKTNGAVFYQLQGVYVDKNVNLGHLKWIFEKALKFILGEDTVIRFRSKYYPEVEPGLSPDIQCKFCHGSGCEVCKHRGWIEIAGGGMIHPTTLQKAGIDNKTYSGLAFGWGLDRVVMNKYKIPDLRTLYSGNIIYK